MFPSGNADCFHLKHGLVASTSGVSVCESDAHGVWFRQPAWPHVRWHGSHIPGGMPGRGDGGAGLCHVTPLLQEALPTAEVPAWLHWPLALTGVRRQGSAVPGPLSSGSLFLPSPIALESL